MWLDIIICLAVFPLILYLSIFLHEAGHVVTGRWVGAEVTSYGVGTERPFWVGQQGDSRLYFCLRGATNGFTFVVFPELHIPKRPLMFFFAGGALMNALAALLFLLVWWGMGFGSSRLELLCLGNGIACNVFLAAVSLMPIKVQLGSAVIKTDGCHILELWKYGGLEDPPTTNVQHLGFFRRLLKEIGDERQLSIRLLMAASSWVPLGDVKQARALFEEADALFSQQESPSLQLFRAMALSSILRAEEDFEAARKLQEEAAALDVPQGGMAEYILEFEKAAWLEASGQYDAALEALDVLEEHPMVKEKPAFMVSLHCIRLACAIGKGERVLVESSMELYETTPEPFRGAYDEFIVYGMLTDFFEKEGEVERVENFYWRTLSALRQLSAAFIDQEKREAFLGLYQENIARVEAFFLQHDLTASTEQLTGFFDEDRLISSLQDQKVKRSEEWDAFFLRWAKKFSLAEFLLSFPLIYFVRGDWLVMHIMMLTFVLVVWGGLFCRFVLGKISPRLQNGWGFFLFIFAMLPLLCYLLNLFGFFPSGEAGKL